METNNLLALQKQIIEGYFKTMKKFGLTIHSSEKLIPSIDQSVLFTNSTIVPLKSKVSEGNLGKGYYLVQPSLRLRNLKNILDEHFFLRKISCFRMVGSLVPHDAINLALDSCLSFLKNVVGLDISKLCILVPKNCDPIILKLVLEKGYLIKPVDDKYIWKYGMPNVTGTGIAFSITLNEGLNTKNIGNLVLVKRNNKPLCCEYGFGLEALIGKAINNDDAFTGSIQYSLVKSKFKNLKSIKNQYRIADLIGVVSAISSTGLSKKDSRKRWSLYNRSLRYLSLVSQENNLEFADILDCIISFNALFFGKQFYDNSHDSLLLSWNRTINSRSFFDNFVKSQEQLFIKRGRGAMKFTKKIELIEYGKSKYNLSNKIVVEILNKYRLYHKNLE